MSKNFCVFALLEKTTGREFVVPETKRWTICQVNGPWDVAFQPHRSAPANAEFPSLMSYTESNDPGVKYFSGQAVYSNVFSFDELPTGKVFIDLRDVRELARVRVNGEDCGVVWKKPFRADITDALQKGENRLEIAVINTWPNRLIGDQQPDCPHKITYTSHPFFTQNSPLRPAGLLGPVLIEVEE